MPRKRLPLADKVLFPEYMFAGEEGLNKYRKRSKIRL